MNFIFNLLTTEPADAVGIIDKISDFFQAGTYFSLICSVTAILVIFFSTRYRNGEHRPLYYVLAAFLPLIGLIVFAVNRKEMNGVGMKRCSSCHRKYPKEFVTCYHCNIELPEYDEKKRNADKILAIVMSVIFAISLVGSAIGTVLNVGSIFDDIGSFISDEIGSTTRKGFEDEDGNTVYYDRKGKKYTDIDSVALYTKSGEKYIYSNASGFFQGPDGKAIDPFSAFVDSNGYLVELDCDNLLYEDGVWKSVGDNKVYYDAASASWNEKGELINNAAVND